jgi:shikimate 5-dehydrogenase
MQAPCEIQTKTAPTFTFIGVTTGRSSIRKIFPLWMEELGRPEIVLEGIDLKIHDSPAAYRAATLQIKCDPMSIGALVTTHKIDLYEAALDLFDYVDPYASICGEVSSISKLEGRLEGHARDPISAGLSLDAILGPGYFGRTGGEVLIFGAGGSAVATVLHLLNRSDPADRPESIVLVNRSEGRLVRAREMVSQLSTGIRIEYVCNRDPSANDRIMAALPEASVVINATGMGKDTPGSPITGAGLFPRHGVAWEFNYRGELDFLHQAERQAASRDLKVEDGWLYFVHGWTQVVAQVLHFDLTPDLFRRLEAIAAAARQGGG